MLLRNALAAAVLCTACTTIDEREFATPDTSDLLLHSDLPLWWDSGDQAVSPRSFSTEDVFGCTSPVRFGDWKLTYTDHGQYHVPDPVWWTVTNYGVFHCGAVFSSSYERGGGNNHRLGFFINLGIDGDSGLELRLWQIGMRPGSDYLLLAQPDGGDRNTFFVLDPDCSAGEMRKVEPVLSIWRTEYCNVPSQQAMRTIARLAAAKPAIGKLELIGEAPKSGR